MKGSISPGPLAPYNIEKALKLYQGKHAPRLTIGEKHSKDKNQGLTTPGPGAYNNFLNSGLHDKNGYSIGQEMRMTLTKKDEEVNKRPGPGAYDVDKKFPTLGGTGKHTAPKFSFTKEQRS